MKKIFTIIILTLICNVSLFSQTGDTTGVSLKPKVHSTFKAVLFSAVIPGAGQIYNGQIIKSFAVVAGIAGMAYAAHIQNERALNSQYDEEMNYYKQDRDKFIIYAVLVYFINIVDAYVDAQFMDFDTGPDLSMVCKKNRTIALSFNWSF
ncbi:hypothetical protein DRQ07_00260 [candidate division KSB1 bacterium]|nr:MAG: hypothetical protein DRQ07_00260 [candidate division KSB1 bacterium]